MNWFRVCPPLPMKCRIMTASRHRSRSVRPTFGFGSAHILAMQGKVFDISDMLNDCALALLWHCTYKPNVPGPLNIAATTCPPSCGLRYHETRTITTGECFLHPQLEEVFIPLKGDLTLPYSIGSSAISWLASRSTPENPENPCPRRR